MFNWGEFLKVYSLFVQIARTFLASLTLGLRFVWSDIRTKNLPCKDNELNPISLAFSIKFAMRSAGNSRLKNIFNVLYNLVRLCTAAHSHWYTFWCSRYVRWTLEASTHLTRILIIPIPSTSPNNVHLCRQLSWCDQIIHVQLRGVSQGLFPFCANSQNFSGIIDSWTPVCVVRHKDNKSLKRGHSRKASNVNFRKMSVRKTIWGLEFSEHLL